MTDVLELLKKSQALLQGHFKLSSGKHSDAYVQCAKLTMHPVYAEATAKVIADKVRDLEVDLVVGPAMGGIVIAYELARQLGTPGIFSERENDEMAFRRGFAIQPGQKVLVCEDVITTGKSSMETVRLIESFGGQVVGLACIVDRSQPSQVPLSIYSALKLEIKTYDPGACPLCDQGLELVKPGSRKKFD